MSKPKKEKIKEFTQKTLGCGCSEDVFEHIGHEKNVAISGDICVDDRINIGNRLLIYILETDDKGFIEKGLAGLIEEGIKERDREGFNRFRLAISTTKPEEINRAAEKAFSRVKKDDRVHIHVIEKDSMPLLSK
jgi:hypothetical protein